MMYNIARDCGAACVHLFALRNPAVNFHKKPENYCDRIPGQKLSANNSKSLHELIKFRESNYTNLKRRLCEAWINL